MAELFVEKVGRCQRLVFLDEADYVEWQKIVATTRNAGKFLVNDLGTTSTSSRKVATELTWNAARAL